MTDPGSFANQSDADDERMTAVRRAITEFSFWNYGLDDVDPRSQYAEWVGDLASVIVGALPVSPAPADRDAAADEAQQTPPAEPVVGDSSTEQLRVTVDGDGFLVHLPEVTYLDTQAWAVDVGLTAEALRQLRDAVDAELRRMVAGVPQTAPTSRPSDWRAAADHLDAVNPDRGAEFSEGVDWAVNELRGQADRAGEADDA